MRSFRVLILLISLCSAFAFAQSNSAAAKPGDPALRIRVSSDALQGMMENKTMPVYPEDALSNGIQGEVVLHITVDEKGKMVTIEGEKGNPLLVAASARALKDTTFHPYLQNGAPITVEGPIGFDFTLTTSGDETTGQVECTSVEEPPHPAASD